MNCHDLQIFLKNRFGQLICSSCQRRGCALKVDSLEKKFLIIIDADRYKEAYKYEDKICDYFLFYLEHSVFVAVSELKSGDIDPRHDGEQL